MSSIRGAIMEGLRAQFQMVLDNAAYDTEFALVSEFEENAIILSDHETPILMVIDTGAEERRVGRDGYTHYVVDIGVRGFVSVTHRNAIMGELNKLISDFRKLVDSMVPSDIHANVRGFTYMGTQGNRYSLVDKKEAADVVFDCRLKYVCQNGVY